MRQKPFILIVISYFHLLAPIGNLFINSYRQNITMKFLWDYWLTTRPIYNLTIYVVIPILSGIFIYICRKWSFFAYILCMIVTVVTSFLGFQNFSLNVSLVAFISAIIFDTILVVYFMLPNVKQVYLDPKLRWWETAPRYKYEVPAQIIDIGVGRISNISIGGVLLFSEVLLQEHQVIHLEFGEGQKFHLTGRVVYHRKMKESGYGIQFDQAHLKRKTLKSLIEFLDKKGERIIDHNFRQMTFSEWLVQLVKTRKGFFPEVDKRKP